MMRRNLIIYNDKIDYFGHQVLAYNLISASSASSGVGV